MNKFSPDNGTGISKETGKVITDPVLIFSNEEKQYIAVERADVSKQYGGKVYEAPVLKAELARHTSKGTHLLTQTSSLTQKTVKFQVIGEAATGKSCMILRYTDDSFTPSFIATIGIDFKTKEKNNIKRRVFDQATKSANFSALKHVDGLILSYDITNRASFDALEEWMRRIRLLGREGTPIILVGTKSDLSDSRKVSQQEAEAFAKNHDLLGPIEASAQNNVNVDECFDMLTNAVIHPRKDASNSEPIQKVIEKLQNYKSAREQHPSTGDYFHFFSAWFGGRPKYEKLAAAQTLIEVLEGKKTIDFLDPYKKSLNQGQLGTLYKSIIPLLKLDAEIESKMQIKVT